MKTASVLFILLALVGCKPHHNDAYTAQASSGTMENPRPIAAPSKPEPVTTAPTDARPAIICFGDSLTAGYGTDPGQSYPDFLQKMLNDKGYAYRVVNEGISGNTSKDGVERLNHITTANPALVVVEFGGNDGLRGLPLDQTKNNIATMLDALQKSGTKVALAGITLPPDYGPDYIAKFNSMYSELAKKYHVPLLPFLLQNVYGVSGSMQDDSTHATAQGNKQVAANIEKLIQPLLKK